VDQHIHGAFHGLWVSGKEFFHAARVPASAIGLDLFKQIFTKLSVGGHIFFVYEQENNLACQPK
jgi:hypothetical protein